MKKRILVSLFFAMFITVYMSSISSAISFGPAVNLGSDVNTTGNERFPDISTDALELYLASDQTGNFDIYKSTRAGTANSFGTPLTLGPTINSTDSDNGPGITPNNAFLFFSSDRTFSGDPSVGDQDIWVSALSGGIPGSPSNVSLVNSSSDDFEPDIATGGLAMFFTSNRSGNNDLYVAKRDSMGDPWGSPTNLAAVNSGVADITPTISSDRLSLYFASNRSGGFGGFDLYVSTRSDTSSLFGAAVNLGASINSSFDDMAPSISSDGTTLYFDSDRSGGVGGFDIYQSTATAVPEPATIALLGIGLFGLAGATVRRRLKKTKQQ